MGRRLSIALVAGRQIGFEGGKRLDFSWPEIEVYRIAVVFAARAIGQLTLVQDRNSDRNSIQVIARAADVLRILAESPEGLSLAEIARETGLARSTIQRIVKALADEQFLEPTSKRGGYILGQGLLRLAAGPSREVVMIAQPFLRQLALDVDETVDLSMLKGSTALFVEHIAGSHRLAALSAVGTEFPLHSTANGKALLACVSAERQIELLVQPLRADTSRTITDLSALQTQLRQIARSGLAFDLEEHTDGVCAIGTAFLDSLGRAYSISIPVPRQRFDQKCVALEAPLLACRDRLIATIHGSLPTKA
ncbi:IclR family transcriptional regulator [Sphingosinicella microcystinivorans]|nr:IclR family transcriptional regulator [Sphingosinicella microcystinivorans]